MNKKNTPKTNKYAVVVFLDCYYEIEADDEEEAKLKALEEFSQCQPKIEISKFPEYKGEKM